MAANLQTKPNRQPLQPIRPEAQHLPDDDEPKPPQLDALSSAQARRAWRQSN